VFTVDDVVTPSHLDTPVGKYLDGLCAVTIFVRQGDLIIKGGWFDGPRDTLSLECIFVQGQRRLFKGATHFVDVDRFRKG
jgi:hypothetical protein